MILFINQNTPSSFLPFFFFSLFFQKSTRIIVRTRTHHLELINSSFKRVDTFPRGSIPSKIEKELPNNARVFENLRTYNIERKKRERERERKKRTTSLTIVSVPGICSGLREVRIQIPTAVKKGDSAILNCWYDTEGDLLYTVKWYKGGREFYRYAPNEIPIFKTFPIGNLTVKVSFFCLSPRGSTSCPANLLSASKGIC